MIYLLLSIVASTCVLVIFRGMDVIHANTRHAITLSYLVGGIFGYLVFNPELSLIQSPWFWPSAIEGAAFYVVFRLIAKTTQTNGVAVASIVTKMSVVIPVGVGIFLFQESTGLYKILGLLTGIIAVLLTADRELHMKQARWPILAFLGAGMIDASFKIFQAWSVSEQDFPGFITTIFAFAFMAGALHHAFCEDKKIVAPSVVSGLALGLVNFATVYFLLSALAQPGWESSVIYAANNFGIVVLSTVVAVLVFRERLSVKAWIGLGLALVSIGLLFNK